MYARISKISAVNEMQLNMFIETYKNVGAKTAMKAGALQLTITKIEKEKAYLIAVFPNKKVATETTKKPIKLFLFLFTRQ